MIRSSRLRKMSFSCRACSSAALQPLIFPFQDEIVLEAAEARLEGEEKQRLTFAAMDLTKSVPYGSYDAAYSLDVIEHVPQESEDLFMTNLCKCLQPQAVGIIGTPNIEASRFASEASMEWKRVPTAPMKPWPVNRLAGASNRHG